MQHLLRFCGKRDLLGVRLSLSLFLHCCSDSVPKPNISLVFSKGLPRLSSLIFPVCLSAVKSQKLVFKVKNENITSQSVHSSCHYAPIQNRPDLSFCHFSFLIHTTINLFLDTVISDAYLFSHLSTEELNLTLINQLQALPLHNAMLALEWHRQTLSVSTQG